MLAENRLSGKRFWNVNRIDFGKGATGYRQGTGKEGAWSGSWPALYEGL